MRYSSEALREQLSQGGKGRSTAVSKWFEERCPLFLRPGEYVCCEHYAATLDQEQHCRKLHSHRPSYLERVGLHKLACLNWVLVPASV